MDAFRNSIEVLPGKLRDGYIHRYIRRDRVTGRIMCLAVDTVAPDRKHPGGVLTWTD